MAPPARRRRPAARRFDDLALPFPSLIDWRRVVIYRNYAQASHLLAELHAMLEHSRHEVRARLAYMESVAHWLVSDVPSVAEDAPAALIHELERRLLPTGTTEVSSTEAPRAAAPSASSEAGVGVTWGGEHGLLP